MDITRVDIKIRLIIFLAAKDGEALYNQLETLHKLYTTPEADRSSDRKLLIVKFRFQLKQLGKTTRPFRYDLNQIPYKYTVEVTKNSRDKIL